MRAGSLRHRAALLFAIAFVAWRPRNGLVVADACDEGPAVNSRVLVYGLAKRPFNEEAVVRVRVAAIENGRVFDQNVSLAGGASSYAVTIPISESAGPGGLRSSHHLIVATATLEYRGHDCVVRLAKSGHARLAAKDFYTRMDFEWTKFDLDRDAEALQSCTAGPPASLAPLSALFLALAVGVSLALCARGRGAKPRSLWERDEKGRLRKQ